MKYKQDKEGYAVYIRNVPPEVYARLKMLSALKRKTINQLINELLAEALKDVKLPDTRHTMD